jgi:hypothetical protein
LLDAYAAAHPTCEVRGCWREPMPTPHHIRKRGLGGGDEEMNLLRLCLWHHVFGAEAWHVLQPGPWYAKFHDRLLPRAAAKVAVVAWRGEPEMLPAKTLVEHVPTGRRGATVSDLASACGPDEVPVVYDGETAFEGTSTAEIKVLGPDDAVADLVRCGAGRGAECCIFLVVGAGGPECARFTRGLHWTLVFRREQMQARREPRALYPGCLLPEPQP